LALLSGVPFRTWADLLKHLNQGFIQVQHFYQTVDIGQQRLTLSRAFHPLFQKHLKQSADRDVLKTQMKSTIMENSAQNDTCTNES